MNTLTFTVPNVREPQYRYSQTGTLANRVSGKTKNPEKLDMEICQPPHSCFECPYSDCIRNGRRFITSPTKEEVEFIHNSGIFKYGGNLNAVTC